MDMMSVVHHIAVAIEMIGISVIVLGIIVASVNYFYELVRRDVRALARFRKKVGHSILVGLELLVAADIIDTVIIQPTMDKILVLGLIVLIRTFLSFSLEIELEGKVPWKMGEKTDLKD